MEETADRREKLPCGEVLEQEPLSRHTTFRIGGPARFLAQPKTEAEARELVKFCRERGIRPFFLGNGSNLLVSDRGYSGVVVKTCHLDRLERPDSPGMDRVVAGSGVLLSHLAAAAADWGLSGLEFASGIPGSLGGGIRMNAGAYGGELSQVVESVTCLDETGEVRVLSQEECGFSYRRSVFVSHPDWLILRAKLALEPGDRSEIRGRMAELNRRRREKQPLEYPSAGSTFKRPQEHFAAALIEECGLKGLTVGGAQVSEKHSGFVINRGGATCADVLALMEEVKARVLEKTGVLLEPEVEILE